MPQVNMFKCKCSMYFPNLEWDHVMSTTSHHHTIFPCWDIWMLQNFCFRDCYCSSRIKSTRFASWSLFAPMDILVAMLLVAYVFGLLTTTILHCAFRDRSQQKQDGSLKPEPEPLLLEKNTVTEAKPEIDATQIYVCLHGKVFHTDMNCRHVKGRLRPVDVFRQCKHCKLSMNKWFCTS